MNSAWLALVVAPTLLVQQMNTMPDLGGKGARPRRDVLQYTAEPATVAAGRRSVLELHLRVADGFHVNSHLPTSDLLIPTAVAFAEAEHGVNVGKVEYPAGTSYRIASDPPEVLSVYTGAVVLRVPVLAPVGEHLLRGTLRYQACDDRACYPVRTLAIEQPFTAR